MTPEQRKRFTVITNPEIKENIPEKQKDKESKRYQTNPLTEKLAKFTNQGRGAKFSIEDLLKW